MKPVYIFLLVILFAIGLYADVYVKSVYHYESRYHHGSLQPGYDQVYEWWIGKNKVSFLSQEYRNYENYLIEPALRVTLDKENKRVIVVNTSDSSYIVLPLPVDFPSAVDPGIVPALKEYRMEGTVEKTGEKTTMDAITCDGYLVKEAIFYGKDSIYDRERKLLTARNVPFAWELTEELVEWIRSFFNPAPGYAAGMKKAGGFIYAAEDVRISRGVKLRSGLKTLEISQKEAPGNIYGIPAGLAKIERLTRDYIIALRRMIYQAGG